MHILNGYNRERLKQYKQLAERDLAGLAAEGSVWWPLFYPLHGTSIQLLIIGVNWHNDMYLLTVLTTLRRRQDILNESFKDCVLELE